MEIAGISRFLFMTGNSGEIGSSKSADKGAAKVMDQLG
jgi:hypothetical protein